MTAAEREVRLWHLYDNAWEQEKYFLSERHRRLVFFGSLLPALVAATIAGALQAGSWWHFIVLLAGPLIIAVISTTASDAMHRSYRRVLEAIALRAKCEWDLGLTEPRAVPGGIWYESEGYIGGRHLRGRREESTLVAVLRDFAVPFFPSGGASHLRITLEKLEEGQGHAEVRVFATSDEFVDYHLDVGVKATYQKFFGAVHALAWVMALVFALAALEARWPQFLGAAFR